MAGGNRQHTSSSVETSKSNLNYRMALYSATAVAAGVGMLALAQPAESEVVVTHVKTPIPLVTSHGLATWATIPIDINGDGINDFSFSNYYFSYHSFHHTQRVVPLTGGEVVITGKGIFYGTAAALPWGQRIGPSANFNSAVKDTIEGTHSGGYFGNWKNSTTKSLYLGVKFPIAGQSHYGWVRVEFAPGLVGTIVSYAYETVPNRPIRAGALKGMDAVKENASNASQVTGPSLGMLALGADGLSLWRREEEQAN